MFELKRSFIFIALLIMMITGCSGSSGLEPENASPDPVSSRESSGRVLWGFWEISFDEKSQTVEVTQPRTANPHFDITDMLIPPSCNDCLDIVVTAWDPVTRIYDANVTLKNPTGINGHDVRGILYTDDAGHLLKNPDDWTGLHDIPGGSTLNPFMAFATSVDSRQFSGFAEHTVHYELYVPIPQQLGSIAFAVDASWPGNCKEPYTIDGFSQTNLWNIPDSEATIEIDVHDWQNDVNKVTLAAPEINGIPFSQFAYAGGTKWSLIIKNVLDVAPGDYEVRVIATSANSGNTALHDYFNITISPAIPAFPQEITPDWLSFSPNDVFFDGTYAYVASEGNGFHIFDCSDLNNPTWLSKLQGNYFVTSVEVVGSYAYLGLGYDGIAVIDVSNPASPTIVHSFDAAGNSVEVLANGPELYIVNATAGLAIADISDPLSAGLLTTIPTTGVAVDVAIQGGYAYVASRAGGLDIIDIEPVGFASLVKNVPTPLETYKVDVAGIYTFVSNYAGIIYMIDNTDIPNAVIDLSFDIGKDLLDFKVVGTNCFIGSQSGLDVWDVEPLNFPPSGIGGMGLVDTVDSLHISGDTIIMGASSFALICGDISDPAVPLYKGYIPTPGNVVNLDAGNGYAYIANGASGIFFIDISTPSAASVYSAYGTGDYARDIKVSGQYAYVANNTVGLSVLNVSNPLTTYSEDSIGTAGYAYGLTHDSGMVYISTLGNGLSIVNTLPIGSGSLDNHVSLTDYPRGVTVRNGYAYVADTSAGVQVIDIDPVAGASIINNLPEATAAFDVAFHGNFLYVADGLGGIKIYDATTPGSEIYITQVSMTGVAVDILISGDYAYVAGGWGGFSILDLTSDLSPYVLSSMTPDGSVSSVAVVDNYLFAGAESQISGGLYIYKLW